MFLPRWFAESMFFLPLGGNFFLTRGKQNADSSDGRVAVRGTTASELTAAIGIYFRDYCNMTIGWPRGGGSNVFMPKQFVVVSVPVDSSSAPEPFPTPTARGPRARG